MQGGCEIHDEEKVNQTVITKTEITARKSSDVLMSQGLERFADDETVTSCHGFSYDYAA